MNMCRRINDLRRERLQALATPQTSQFYAEDGLKIVPMSRLTEKHFWDLFHKLPITTTDPAKWKSVLKFLDSCPQAPRGPPSSRDVEWASGDLLDAPALPGQCPSAVWYGCLACFGGWIAVQASSGSKC